MSSNINTVLIDYTEFNIYYNQRDGMKRGRKSCESDGCVSKGRANRSNNYTMNGAKK